ncbi:hypothetical protein LTR22_028056, partial [Elasticomyces elasticus]
MVRRGAKNVLIQKPIPSQTSTASITPTCDGHAVARVIHQLVETYEDLLLLDQNAEGGHALCRSCRPVTLRAFEALEEILIPCVRELLAVDVHRFDSDEDVLLSQLTEDSQPARPLKRKRPQIPDSSNESTQKQAGCISAFTQLENNTAEDFDAEAIDHRLLSAVLNVPKYSI